MHQYGRPGGNGLTLNEWLLVPAPSGSSTSSVVSAPVAAGMAAALPSVDAFVEGHSLAALERPAAAVVCGAGPAPVEGADRA
ncbi:hypothetical protein [Streptomyces sp. NPDC001604]|uniref:hypothetical protein n=1 Tax=Streptomyces sp. NPDC001604 TaxID=3364593 RepID=UPI0036865121